MSASLEIPADRSHPPVGGEILFELDLTLGEVRGIDEMLSSLRAVDVNHTQLVPAIRQVADFVPEELATALKPPEHKPSRRCVGTKR